MYNAPNVIIPLLNGWLLAVLGTRLNVALSTTLIAIAHGVVW